MPKQKTDERIRALKKHSWQKRKRRLKLFLYSALTAVFLFLLFNAKRLLTAMFWDVKTFRIENVRIAPGNAQTLITGLLQIETGKSLLFLDTDGLREQINNIREIENCTVRKIYPSTVEINVIMRKPWAVMETGTDAFFIDRTGKILLPPENTERLLRISGIDIKENAIAPSDLWKLEVLQELEKCYNLHNLRKYFNIKNIRIAGPTEIILNEAAGTRKIILVNEDIPEKIENLRAVFEECERNATEWVYIDLRFKNPYVKHTQRKDEQ